MEARELMQSAYENRYTWDKDFPGYVADIQLKQGDEVYQGQVQINPNLSAEVMGIDNDEVRQTIAAQLQEIAIHRIRRAFEDSHGKNTFAYGTTDETGAVELLVGGKAEGDRYKVRNKEVCLVHRHIHGIVVTIDTYRSVQTDEGYLPETYHSVYRDPKTGELKGEQDFEDHYEKVGDYYILSSRTLQDHVNSTTSEFSFSNIKLLQPALV